MSKIIHHARQHFQKHYVGPHGRHAHLVLTIDLTLVAVILTLLGVGAYFAFFFKPLRDDFRFEVLTTEPIVAGRRVTARLKVSNVGKSRLHDVRIQAHLPPEFQIAEYPQGYDAATEMTSFGPVPPGGSVEMTLIGTVFGPPRWEPVFARMTATDEQGRPDERVFEVPIGWQENLISGRLAFPTQVVANQNVTARYTLTNGSAIDLETVKVVPAWPDNFRVTASSPPAYKGAVSVGPIKAGESVAIDFVGRYSGRAESFLASVEAFWQKDGADILLDRTEINRTSANVDLRVQAVFGEGLAAYVRPGDEVPVVLTYDNQSSMTLKDVRFELPLDPRIFDEGQPSLAFEAIKELAPGAKGETKAVLKLKPRPSRYAKNPVLALKPTATFTLGEPGAAGFSVAGAGAEIKVAGSAALALVGRYYTLEGEQVGRGPLPPKAGRETRYWAFASLTTGATDLAHGRLVIPLGPGVRWTGRSSVSAGAALEYDATANALVWDLGTLPAQSGVADEAPVASFELGLTPTADQVGRYPVLAGPARFEAVDSWTGLDLAAEAPTLTTRLPQDQFAKGRGAVKP